MKRKTCPECAEFAQVKPFLEDHLTLMSLHKSVIASTLKLDEKASKKRVRKMLRKTQKRLAKESSHV